ncbi:uncharacterized protein [Chironomus tepperi]|uniref:uncharacterized protein n=1 Tax=Chironomus tepperi TaxID=113505 RepID=UPI00391F28C6
MAVPFNIPDEEEVANSEILRNSQAINSQPSSPTRPMSIPIRSDNSPQSSPLPSPVDNEMLVQAFYEALCRCSQELPNFHISPPASPSSPFNQGHFIFPPISENFQSPSSPSTSVFSSPRSSFRINQTTRRRLDSYGNHSQYSHFSEDSGIAFENDTTNCEQIHQIEEEILSEVLQPKRKSSNKKKPKDANKSSKITNLVISALQFVIDTLK